MNKIFGTSWKTSLFGYISAAAVVIYPLMQKEGFNIEKDWKSLAVAAGLAIWGRIQKDSNGIKASEAQVVKEAASAIVEESKL